MQTVDHPMFGIRRAKIAEPGPMWPTVYPWVGTVKMAAVLAKVALSPPPKRGVLTELGISTSTYCRRRIRKHQQRLDDHAGP